MVIYYCDGIDDPYIWFDAVPIEKRWIPTAMLNSHKVNQTKCNVYIVHVRSDIFTCLWYMMIYDDIWWYMTETKATTYVLHIYIYITILYETTIKNIIFDICPMYIYIMYVFVLPVEVLATFITSPRFPITFGKMSGSWSIPGIKIIGYPIEVVN
jgi:FlaA1/EpsC-like NDP-sugar epimerase